MCDQFKIGDDKLFSIHCRISCVDEARKNVFGFIWAYCESVMLGQQDMVVILNVPVSQFTERIQNYNFFMAKQLDFFIMKEAYKKIHNGYLYAETWQKGEMLRDFLILVDASESFDGENFALISTEKYDRIIFKAFGDKNFQECYLPKGYVFGVLNEFIKKINNYATTI